MTEAETQDDAVPAPAPTRSEAAFVRYRNRIRRARIVYFSVVGLVLALVLAGVAVAWSRGEASHASLRLFSPPPQSLAVQDPSPSPRPTWRSTDRLALGAPQAGGTVITFSAHTVGGRDARTGRRTWSYTRTDRTMCTAVQASGTTIAVFEKDGNCDQVSAFASDTGRRRWTRTLDKDGQPLDGTPAYQVLPYTVMLTSDTTIYAIDPVTGLDRWTYYRYGCRINRAVLGSAGALISQTCAPPVRCKGVKFCATGPQLFLRDGSAGNGDDSDKNSDKIKWLRRGETSLPVSADGVISTVRQDGTTLELLAQKDGAAQGTVTLPAASATAETTTFGLGSVELVWRSGRLFAIRAERSTPVWAATAAGPPTAVAASGAPAVSLGDARITVPFGDGVGLLDANDGRVTRRFTLPAPQGATVYPLGTGFLIAGPDGVTAYR